MRSARPLGALVAAMLAVGAALAACSASGGSDPNELRVGVWGVNSDIDSIKAAAEPFLESHPDITIRFEPTDCGPDYAACKTLLAGQNMPDVIVPGSWNYFDMVRDDILADLSPALEAAGYGVEDFTPAVIDALSTDDGQLHGLPMGYNAQSLFYNEELFAAAGLEPPPADGSYTWDDLREWARQLTLDSAGNNADSPDFDPDDIVQWGYYNRFALVPPNEPGYGPVLASFGGGVLAGPQRDQCVLDQPETIEAFQLLQDMMLVDHSMVTPQMEQEQPGYLRWVEGQVAMQQGSHEQVPIAAEQNPDLSYDIAALPAGPAGNATLLQIHIWAAYAGSDKLDLATEFATWMATEGSGQQMGLIPAFQDRAMGPDFAEAPGEPGNLVEAQIEPAAWPLTYVNVDPSNVWAAISGQDGFAPALEDLQAGRKTAAEALSGICATIDEIIAAQE